MPKLPRQISAKKVLKAICKLGYTIDHQTGSHIILRQEKEPYRRLTIPNHRHLAPGTLRAIIRQAGLRREEFVALLE
jgi:predicted RNA binding protein YcfA (HicA-like mRNA interferase family)